MQKFILSLRIFILLSIMLGLIYPLFLMAIGKLCFPYQANGSLITHQGKIIGSALIAQKFTMPEYFHSRFSAIDYNASISGGSNFSSAEKSLYLQTRNHIQQVRADNQLTSEQPLPADMVLTSASGLDPHISLENALLQLLRVAHARHLAPTTIKNLIIQNTKQDFMGIWGQTVVNVLQLNLALNKLQNTGEF